MNSTFSNDIATINADDVFGAYVSGLQLTSITDGTAPFDKSSGNGNDENATNKIIRTFDTIHYVLRADFRPTNPDDTYSKVTINYELVLNKDITEAQFDAKEMLWLKAGWKIEYLDVNENVIYTETKSGIVDKNGKTVKINDITQDSTKGEESYRTENAKIVKQRLVGKYDMERGNGEIVVPGNSELDAFIKVKASKNGTTFEPEFRVWIEGNEENIGAGNVKNNNNVYNISSRNENTRDNVITVSAAPRYNVLVKRNPDCSYKTYLNLETGQEEKTKKDNTILGRIYSYGVTLQLYNETDNKDIELQDKGLKGIELPQGEISFDIKLTESEKNGGSQIQDEQYIPILWDYYENKNVNSLSGDKKNKGHWGRNMYWNNEMRTPYAKGGAPYNTGNNNSSCYQGGTWTITDDKITSTENLINANRVFHVTVSGYDFDLDNYKFPSESAGNSGAVPWLKYAYMGSFSAGQFQVAIQFPENLPDTANVYPNVEISNLKATSISNQNGREIIGNDNNISAQAPFYNKGSISKGNAFNSKDARNTGDKFLGTGYWTDSYDCSAYVSDRISIMDYTILNAGCDDRLRAVNMLQKFDSKALEIDTDGQFLYNQEVGVADKAGTATFLYAADPLYPNGYDSNDKIQMKRMNNAKEEDYIYFKTIEELESKGYTCIAVLIELRDLDVMGGKYAYCRIPIKVRENSELVGKTICTTNTSRGWKNLGDMSGVTWINGNYDATTHKNTLDGWKAPDFENLNDKSEYVKTEYENGVQVPGTHKNGPYSGISLLILGYQAKVEMKVQNTDTGEIASDKNSSVNFDVGKGQRKATYIINAETSTGSTSGSGGKTNLIAKVELDEKLKVTPKGYKINDIIISDEPEKPTITTNSNGDEISIYARRDTNGNKIEFYLSNVPIGTKIPSITFTAEIGTIGGSNDVNNGEHLQARVSILGEGDNRAITEENGNISISNIGIISLGSATLSKLVNKELVEINEGFLYTLKYSNTGQNAVKKSYIYDLMPYNSDSRNSKVDGLLDVQQIDATLIDGEEKDFNAIIDIYYSTIPGEKVKPIVETFGDANEHTGSSIDEMLEKGYLGSDGKYHIDTNNSLGNNVQYKKLFSKWGRIENGSTQLKRENISTLDEAITCIYAVIQNVQVNKTLSIDITMNTHNNEAANVYGNTFYNWIAENLKSSSLKSNTTYTTVVSRSISGVVWNDENCNGVKDANEDTLSGVEVTLFKYNENTSKYEPCVENISGQPIDKISTNEKGEYEFNKLSPGEYIVAFKGSALNGFSTTEYQVNNKNDENTNDGVKIGELNIPEITGYSYAIKYSTTDSNFKLHTIKEIEDENIALENYQEKFKQQDLGLCKVKDFEFTKVKAENTDSVIANTQFAIYRLVCKDATHTAEYHDSNLIDEKNENTCWEYVTTKTSDKTGKVKFEEMVCNEEYRLIETKASLNRLKPEGQWKIIIDENEKINIKAVGDKLPLAFIEKDGQLLLPNMAMFSIPTSGNIGTEIFKVFGLLFIIGGSYLLITIKRKPKMRGKH